jgi:putative hemolysin
MNPPILEILLLLFLILINALFAMAEFAIISSRKSKLQQMVDEGNAEAARALEMALHPDRILATIQVGITLIGSFAGAIGGATLARELAATLATFPLLADYAGVASVTLVALGIAVVTLLLGELVPKQLALHNPERIAMSAAGPLRALTTLVSPVVRLLTGSSQLVIRLLGVSPSSDPPVTEDEIKVLMEQGTQAGVFEEAEQDMVESIFKLGEQRAGAVMTPRPQIDWIDIDEPAAHILQRITESRRTRFPVSQGDLDRILGILHTKDLLVQSFSGGAADIKSLLRPCLFVPESMEALSVLERFKRTGSHLALVTDEYGTITGLLTSTDILETIVGDLPSVGEPSEIEALRREDGSWLVGGKLHIEELKDLLEWNSLPEGEEGAYGTVGGFVMDRLGEIPQEGDHFEWNGYRFEVVDMDGRRVDKVIIAALPSEDSDSVPAEKA